MNTEQVEVVNPFDRNAIGHVPLTNWDQIDQYLNDAQKLFQHRKSWLPAHKRIAILNKVAELMKGRAEELAFQIANEGGKPLIDARIEVARAIDGVGLCIKELSHLAGQEIPMDLTAAGSGRLAFTTREPIGVVVAVSAFNHPLNLIVHQVGPAVAVGCPVIVKPASATPLSAQAFVHMLYEAGLPEEWCRLAVCKSAVAEKMVTDPRVNFFSFIGSGAVGWMLKSKLAPGTRCALEHGGVAPVIVDESANLESMLPALVKGGFYHSGQVCVSVQRIYVHKGHGSGLAQMLATEAKHLVVGNAIEEKTQCGPLINPAEVTRVESWVNEAVQGGAKVLSGGHRLSDTTYAPTVLLNPALDAKVSELEVFGPVMCVYETEDINHSIHLANSLPVAFQASVFTNHLDVAMKCVREIDATAVMVNDHTAFRVDWMPFAGRRHSGYGVGGIGYTMHDMTHDKMAVIKL